VGLHYDPLLGKLILYGSDRSVALDRLARALDELVIIGVETCTDVHRRLVRDADFRAGELSIRFLEEHPHVLGPGQGSGVGAHTLPAKDEARRRAAAVMAALLEDAHRRRLAPADQRASGTSGADGRLTAWQTAGWPWRRR
jgi:acetyl-CoA carboxylase biotin carboxylase subunit